MRKIITILLLIVFFTSQTGYYFLYVWQQHQVKRDVKRQLHAGIPDSSLEIIVANESKSFRWEEEGKEFSQGGQMYDVVKSVIKNGMTILYCLNDVKEKELLHNFTKALKSGSHRGTKQTLKIQMVDFLAEPETAHSNFSKLILLRYWYFHSSVITISKEIAAPPPRA